jgi:Ca2+-binding RTX toxin-like protein
MAATVAVLAAVVGAAGAVPPTEQAKLSGSDGAVGDAFGLGVAMSGDTIVVGAPTNNDRGAVYVFTRTDHGWAEAAKLTAADVAVGAHFGAKVAISDDTIVVGAILDDANGEGSGSAYIFRRASGVWFQEAKLTPSDPVAWDNFGDAVAVDGDTVVIGAPWREADPYSFGSAHVFEYNAGVWEETAALSPPYGVPDGSNFGWAVDVIGDTAFVLATYGDDDGPVSGVAYEYIRSPDGWVEAASLTASDGGPLDAFGWSMATGDAGGTLAIGAPQHDGLAQGAVYVFARRGNGWEEDAKLTPSDGTLYDEFGESVVMDGEYLLVGAPQALAGGSRAGAAYLFVRTGEGWSEVAKLTATAGAPSDMYGFSVGADEGTFVIGAFRDSGAGSAYVFGSGLLSDPTGPRLCTVSGTPGDDVLIGTAGSDVICGRGGNDTLYGLGGDDLLLGGSGDDRIYGGAGADTIKGNAGRDLLIGGAGGDLIRGGGGPDTLKGRAGDDRLIGNKGHDTLRGARGADELLGGRGTDDCVGGLGSDTLAGCE